MTAKSCFSLSEQPTTCTFYEPDKSSPRPPTNVLKIHFNIIKPPIPGTSTRPLKLRLPHHNNVCNSPVSYTCHMSRQSRSFWFEKVGLQTIHLHIIWSPLPHYLVPRRPKYPTKHPVLEQPQLKFLRPCDRSRFTPIQNKRKISVLCIMIFIFLVSKLEDKRFCTEWKEAFPDFSLLLMSIWMEFLFVRVFPNIWIEPTFNRIYYLSSYCDLSCVLISRHDHVLSFINIYFWINLVN